jgi:hypothetical protein
MLLRWLVPSMAVWLVAAPPAAGASRCRVRHATPVSRLHVARSHSPSQVRGWAQRRTAASSVMRQTRQRFSLRFQRGNVRPPEVAGRSLVSRAQRTRLRSVRAGLGRQFRSAASPLSHSRQRFQTIFHPCP